MSWHLPKFAATCPASPTADIPQVFVNGELIGGCDIVLEMYQTGELKTVLEQAGTNTDKTN